MSRLIENGYSPASPVVRDVWANADQRPAPAAFRVYAGATAFCFFAAIIWFVWAVSMINTVFTDSFPQLGTMPAYGNVFPYGYLSDRYGWDWAMVLLLNLNVLLPMLMAYALANNEIETWRHLHEFLSKMFMLINVVVFIVLTWRWAFYCNTSYSAQQSACNAYTYCCAAFPSPWCPNNSPCNPNYNYGDLSRNFEMYMHWVFSMVFFVFSCWSFNQNGQLVALGVLA